jgi:hypothetical protein
MIPTVDHGDSRTGWHPLRGSWEESVLTWNEQVDLSFRHQRREDANSGQSAQERVIAAQSATR